MVSRAIVIGRKLSKIFNGKEIESIISKYGFIGTIRFCASLAILDWISNYFSYSIKHLFLVSSLKISLSFK